MDYLCCRERKEGRRERRPRRREGREKDAVRKEEGVKGREGEEKGRDRQIEAPTPIDVDACRDKHTHAPRET